MAAKGLLKSRLQALSHPLGVGGALFRDGFFPGGLLLYRPREPDWFNPATERKRFTLAHPMGEGRGEGLWKGNTFLSILPLTG
jgi:hypothetical protein